MKVNSYSPIPSASGGSSGFTPVKTSAMVRDATVSTFSTSTSSSSSARKPGTTTWWGISWLMLTDVVGTSVLTFAGVSRQLGWVLTGIFLIGLCPVSIYTANLMSRTRIKLCELGKKPPASMGEAAALTLGCGDTSKMASAVVYFVVYGFAFLGNGTYLLTMGNSLQGVFYDEILCLPSAVFIACLCCLPIFICVRNLSDSVALCFANLFLILAVLAIVMAKMWAEGPQEDASTYLFAEDLSLFTVFGTMTNIVYSYTGQWVYFEMMDEMAQPEDFPKVFRLNAPLQVGLYVLVAFWGYYFAGDQAKGYFLDNVPASIEYSWASGILFIHVGIAYLIKNVVVARFLHKCIAPHRVDARIGDSSGEGFRAHAEYAVCAILVLVGNAMLALSIPFFSDLLGLLGGLLSGPISFILPIAFFVGVNRLQSKRERENEDGPETGDVRPTTSDSLIGFERPAAASLSEDLSLTLLGCGRCKRQCTLKGTIETPVDLVLGIVISVFIIMTMFVGTFSVIQQIAEKSAENHVFSCMPLRLAE